MIVKWNKQFETGIESIDAEHKELLMMYGELYEMMREGKGHSHYNETLNFLLHYVDKHFKNEEEYMLKINYDSYQEHKNAHDEFKAKIHSLVDQYMVKEITDIDLIDINIIVKDWLLRHILKEDLKIGEFAGTLPSE